MGRLRALLGDIGLEDVMNRDFAVFSPLDTVARGLEMVYPTGQDDFPVLQDGPPVGMLSPVNISRYMLVQTSVKSSRRARRRHAVSRIAAPPPVISSVPPVAAPRPREESSPRSDRA